MAGKTTKGKCFLCDSEFAGSGMTRHLKTCIPKTIGRSGKTAKSKPNQFYHVLVKGQYSSLYWLHLKVLPTTKLESLDGFLREIWLECCGHLSSFNFGRWDEIPKSRRIEDVLPPGMEMQYTYDFGSSTELLIKAISAFEAFGKKKTIDIMARNNPPEVTCDECGQMPAKNICTECQWEGEGWLCDKCSKIHECGEEMMLPVVNSPRTGVCGYMG